MNAYKKHLEIALEDLRERARNIGYDLEYTQGNFIIFTCNIYKHLMPVIYGHLEYSKDESEFWFIPEIKFPHVLYFPLVDNKSFEYFLNKWLEASKYIADYMTDTTWYIK